MTDKEYICPKELTHDSFLLARRVYDSGFRPDFIIVLWRGGTPIGIIVQEFFKYKGVETYHSAIKVEAYTGIGKMSDVHVADLDWLLKRIGKEHSILLVDDIFDSGKTMEKVSGIMKGRCGDVKIATLYYKPEKNQTKITPDFFVRPTDKWIVFPHEVIDLTDEELKEKDPFVWKILKGNL
ncbi:hypoxanthine phosphoribosyltransferase [Candidatus Woesearchaeota archaeon CG11_big_fil_rev_8_21_14_0_20_43_8]|nr:MAG: hypoxanthine phosphoribosyltransferase [Candidatus Woesearchaeota archaeon CG11_big_fil_rev_8_21_14_0_20_43_8]PIO05314.1 MAG: hypoxanthine phosphoribosyltransferase [Candidatus Woesearchaeota archaeon CG08_land_8_20_14_0_20_43_7]